MAMIRTNNSLEDTVFFRIVCMAHEENKRYDIKKSIRNRTMTRKSYLQLHHDLREFFWNLKHNRFCGAWAGV